MAAGQGAGPGCAARLPAAVAARRPDRRRHRGGVPSPQVMAYAGVAGLPPVTGLWAALPALACYAVLGSSRLVPLGPESTTALMTAVAIGLAAGAHTQLLRANPVNRTKGARGAAQTRHIQNGAAAAD